MSHNRVALFHNTPVMAKHVPPRGSRIPETPVRITECQTYLEESGIWSECDTHLVTAPLPEPTIVAEYGPDFIHKAERIAARDGDVFLSADSWTAARIAAQAACDAALHSWHTKQNSFALVRPPGHHCFDVPAGFCLMNNVALAAKAVLAMGARRVAIVDWDYHFGDGTAKTFLGDERVMFVSLHAAKTIDGCPTYPASPLKGDALLEITQGRSWNIQWARDNADDVAWAYAFKHVLLPALSRFEPDLVLVSAGYDAVKGDTLAGMNVSPAAFGSAAASLKEVGVPVCAVLEGGYNPALLAACVGHTIRGLAGHGHDAWHCNDLPAGEHQTVVDALKIRLTN